eukprot:403372619
MTSSNNNSHIHFENNITSSDNSTNNPLEDYHKLNQYDQIIDLDHHLPKQSVKINQKKVLNKIKVLDIFSNLNNNNSQQNVQGRPWLSNWQNEDDLESVDTSNYKKLQSKFKHNNAGSSTLNNSLQSPFLNEKGSSTVLQSRTIKSEMTNLQQTSPINAQNLEKIEESKHENHQSLQLQLMVSQSVPQMKNNEIEALTFNKNSPKQIVNRKVIISKAEHTLTQKVFEIPEKLNFQQQQNQASHPKIQNPLKIYQNKLPQKYQKSALNSKGISPQSMTSNTSKYNQTKSNFYSAQESLKHKTQSFELSQTDQNSYAQNYSNKNDSNKNHYLQQNHEQNSFNNTQIGFNSNTVVGYSSIRNNQSNQNITTSKTKILIPQNKFKPPTTPKNFIKLENQQNLKVQGNLQDQISIVNQQQESKKQQLQQNQLSLTNTNNNYLVRQSFDNFKQNQLENTKIPIVLSPQYLQLSKHSSQSIPSQLRLTSQKQSGSFATINNNNLNNQSHSIIMSNSQRSSSHFNNMLLGENSKTIDLSFQPLNPLAQDNQIIKSSFSNIIVDGSVIKPTPPIQYDYNRSRQRLPMSGFQVDNNDASRSEFYNNDVYLQKIFMISQGNSPMPNSKAYQYQDEQNLQSSNKKTAIKPRVIESNSIIPSPRLFVKNGSILKKQMLILRKSQSKDLLITHQKKQLTRSQDFSENCKNKNQHSVHKQKKKDVRVSFLLKRKLLPLDKQSQIDNRHSHGSLRAIHNENILPQHNQQINNPFTQKQNEGDTTLLNMTNDINQEGWHSFRQLAVQTTLHSIQSIVDGDFYGKSQAQLPPLSQFQKKKRKKVLIKQKNLVDHAQYDNSMLKREGSSPFGLHNDNKISHQRQSSQGNMRYFNENGSDNKEHQRQFKSMDLTETNTAFDNQCYYQFNQEQQTLNRKSTHTRIDSKTKLNIIFKDCIKNDQKVDCEINSHQKVEEYKQIAIQEQVSSSKTKFIDTKTLYEGKKWVGNQKGFMKNSIEQKISQSLIQNNL